MKINKTKSAIAAIAIIASPSASATYPTIDVSNLIEAISGNIQEAAQYAEKKAMDTLGLDLEALLAKMNIQAINNAAANTIARTNDMMATVQNAKAMEGAIPDDDACHTIGNVMIQRAIGNANDSAQKALANARTKNTVRPDDTVVEQNQNMDAIDQGILDNCMALPADGSTAIVAEDKNGMSKSLCQSANLLITDKNLYSDDEAKAVTQMINLLSGPYPVYSDSPILDSASGRAERVRLMRLSIFKNLAFQSLEQVTRTRKASVDGVSEMLALAKLDDERFGSPEWLGKAGNILSAAANDDMTSELIRKMTALSAIQSHMQLLMYKQQLRMETLQAAMLALEVEPVQ